MSTVYLLLISTSNLTYQQNFSYEFHDESSLIKTKICWDKFLVWKQIFRSMIVEYFSDEEKYAKKSLMWCYWLFVYSKNNEIRIDGAVSLSQVDQQQTKKKKENKTSYIQSSSWSLAKFMYEFVRNLIWKMEKKTTKSRSDCGSAKIKDWLNFKTGETKSPRFATSDRL